MANLPCVSASHTSGTWGRYDGVAKTTYRPVGNQDSIATRAFMCSSCLRERGHPLEPGRYLSRDRTLGLELGLVWVVFRLRRSFRELFREEIVQTVGTRADVDEELDTFFGGSHPQHVEDPGRVLPQIGRLEFEFVEATITESVDVLVDLAQQFPPVRGVGSTGVADE